MKKSLCLKATVCLVAGWVVVNMAYADLLAEDELERIQAMQTKLAKGGLGPMFEFATAHKWPMPKIRSSYWVEQLPRQQMDIIKLEQAKRVFGLAIAKALDEESLKLNNPADNATREKQVKQLFDLADWLGEVHGYGNIWLTARARNMGCIPLGYLIADLKYPSEKLEAMLARLPTQQTELEFRLEILDEESPVKFDVSRDGTVQQVNERLDVAFGKGWHEMAAWCKENGLESANAGKKRGKLSANRAFFVDDDEFLPPFTTTRKWDAKQHHATCIYGPVIGIRDTVQKLYLFRKKIGKFPTSKPAWYKDKGETYSVIAAAFLQAYDPYMIKNNCPNIGGVAASAYESILNHRFLDMDTWEIVTELEQVKKTNEKNKAKEVKSQKNNK